MAKYITIANLVILLICYVESARILSVFQHPSKSHHILGKALMMGLVERGHDVTFVSSFPDDDKVKNYRHIELTGINNNEKLLNEWLKSSIFNVISLMKKAMMESNMKVLQHENLKKLMSSNKEHFDVVIQFWGFSEAMLGIANHFKAPVIAFNSIGGNYFAMTQSGNPTPYSYVPHMFLGYSDKMSFKERIVNTLAYVASDVMYYYGMMPLQNEIYQRNFPNGRPLDELVKEVNIHLMNSHFSSETIRPYLPNVIPIGGYHLEAKESIPVDILKYLDDSKNGVILVSFGTNLTPKSFSPKDKEAIVKTLAKQSMNVLWKFDEDIPEKSSNVRIEKWIPQKSVLLHPNVKLFINHGGMGGIAESMYAGVPIVGIPFFGDQSANVAKAVKDGFAVKIASDNITEENLSGAIEEILNNPSYTQKIQLISSLYRDQPITPMNTAIFWIEHVIKHKGAKHLRAAASDMPLFQYYLLDVTAFLAAVVLVFVFTTYFVTKKVLCALCRLVCRKSKGKKTEKIKRQ